MVAQRRTLHGFIVQFQQQHPIQRRMRAAQAAIAYEHPRLAVTAVTSDEDLAVRMQQALEARMKVINGRATEVLRPPAKAEPQVASPQVDEPMQSHSLVTTRVGS